MSNHGDLDCGSVIVWGTSGTFDTFDKVARPNEFRRRVQERLSSATRTYPTDRTEDTGEEIRKRR